MRDEVLSPLPAICFHGHFYQPSRIDPWSQSWDPQDSAAPFRDWNTRIAAECYGPNLRARLLDDEGRTRDFINTYSRMSFDVGPTLIHWLEHNAPWIREGLIEADRESIRRTGHGAAIAQAYHHPILPLCDEQDQRLEIKWGLDAFERCFGRRSEGLWLPETAVDTATLTQCAEAGVKFVIVSAEQIDSVCAPESATWQSADSIERIDGRGYIVDLPTGTQIHVLPYAMDLSAGISFGGWLHDGEGLASRLRDAAQKRHLALSATDGESYGHHHAYGEMALARAMEILEQDQEVQLTNAAAFLQQQPVRWKARIREESSWSCAHGIERWRSDCGCRADAGRNWHQAWREPYRAALESLRDQARSTIKPFGNRWFQDPNSALEAYGHILEDPDAFGRWLEAHGTAEGRADQSKANQWLETHRHLMAMFTSCAWFFDEVTGIEPLQNIRHAAYAVAQVQQLTGVDLAADFRAKLERLPSNVGTEPLLQTFDQYLQAPPSKGHPSATSPRAAGVLLPVSALVGPGPIGSLDGAIEAIDWMSDAGFKTWQILPLGPTDRHGSPYSSWSALSGNPALVGLRWLRDQGLADTPEDRVSTRSDYGAALDRKVDRVCRAARSLLAQPDHPLHERYLDWKARHDWAEDAAIFRAIKADQNGAGWWQWPEPLRTRSTKAIDEVKARLTVPIQTWQAALFLFEEQWRQIRRYGQTRGLEIVGDLPLYVAWDSVDAWTHPELFQLTADGFPTFVAGCPPDAFSETGQRWGNPLYDWPRHQAEDFRWWLRRVQRNLDWVDSIRIDHFIGFSRYFSIPAQDEDARGGRWVEGPGAAFFHAVQSRFGHLPFWVEDLGEVDAATIELRDQFELPGMGVLQFGFHGGADNPHAPDNLVENMIAYPGTHDNDTLLGWWRDQSPEQRLDLDGAEGEDERTVVKALIDRVLKTRPRMAVLPIQDLLIRGSEARFNVPGTTDDNWAWRLGQDDLIKLSTDSVRSQLRDSERLYPQAHKS